MKAQSIIILMTIIAISYSCKKDREVSTTITGQLRTNGTEDRIKMSSEISQPNIVLYERIDQIGYTSSGYRVYSKTTVDAKANLVLKKS